MIPVTKTYLPDFEAYNAIVKRAWEKGWITNNGDLVQELEQKLKQFLGLKQLWFTTNGTVVLQMALKALGIKGEVITTPFSYVATTNCILWEGAIPVFVDVDPQSGCIDANAIEQSITPQTEAILATHVFGIPCDVFAIQSIASKHGLKVIYDGAHAFGCVYQGKSLLDYGDISTCSFHATKVFHTTEGGCIVVNDDALARQLYLYRQFGHDYEDYASIGINAKNSEIHAAMGLAILPHFEAIVAQRRVISEQYDKGLLPFVQRPELPKSFSYNYGYYPVIFKNEQQLLAVIAALNKADIFPRRYFYPSLNTLRYIAYQPMPVSESLARRIACLPLYKELAMEDVARIIHIIRQHV